MPRKSTAGPHRYQYELGKRNYNFAAQVDAIVAKTEKRMTALARESIQRTIDIAQMPVAKGGKMRVDTGFLRASGQASYNGMPTGETRGEVKGEGEEAKSVNYTYDGTGATTQLSKLQLGTIFYFGWTAAYAKYREAYDGFLETAVQKWPDTVAKVTEEIKARIK